MFVPHFSHTAVHLCEPLLGDLVFSGVACLTENLFLMLLPQLLLAVLLEKELFLPPL